MSEPDFEDAFRSHHHAEKTTDDPFVRVMALHALAYCERLSYVRLLPGCAQRVIDTRDEEGRKKPAPTYEVF
jgi:hypothetical protein